MLFTLFQDIFEINSLKPSCFRRLLSTASSYRSAARRTARRSAGRRRPGGQAAGQGVLSLKITRIHVLEQSRAWHELCDLVSFLCLRVNDCFSAKTVCDRRGLAVNDAIICLHFRDNGSTLCMHALPFRAQDAEVEAPIAAAQGDPELAGLEARLANLKR